MGIPALEDKIVQSAVGEVLAATYEVGFLDFSCGFRPGRSAHQALSVLHTSLMMQRVNWVLDADICSFFDSVNHEWITRVLAVRIAGRRGLRLTGALLDRLAHRVHILEANGESYRLRDSKNRLKKRKSTTRKKRPAQQED